MTSAEAKPERTALATGLDICRIVTGLWQMADQERDGRSIDLQAAAEALADYADAGFDTFDMADHYGSAEIVAGLAAKVYQARGGARPTILTKWVPAPGPMMPVVVRDGVRRALDRLQLERIDLMQLHWWSYEHPAYLDALAELMRLRQEGLIGHLGVTNFDTAHLRVLVKNGFEIASNQVCFSLLDRRAAGEMSAFCLEHGVAILAYGTLAGGFLTERWLAAPEPTGVGDWSRMKYRRFIEAAGGWAQLQALLRALHGVARKHGVSIANVAARWVLDHPAVAAVIVGARLGEREHRSDNLRVFSFALDAADRALVNDALAATAPIPGDCGDEYRGPPFLTASGDLSHHFESLPQVYAAAPVPGRPERQRIGSGSVWEVAGGYSRAVRAATVSS